MRAVYKEYFDVCSPDGRLRFQSLSSDDAAEFATKHFERSAKKSGTVGEICNIQRRSVKA